MSRNLDYERYPSGFAYPHLTSADPLVRQLAEHAEFYRARLNRTCQRSDHWEGKFRTVKHENNQLRRKLA